MDRIRVSRSLPLSLVLLALPLLPTTALRASDEPPPSPAEVAAALVAKERTRAAVEAAFDIGLQQVEDPQLRLDLMIEGADRLCEIGADAVPYLVNEAEQENRDTYYFVTYALGRLGTPGAREGLRAAMSRADGQTGDYAVSRKGWAGWCLALAGDPDSVRLVNEGHLLAGIEPIYRDFTAIEAAALFAGGAAVPALVEQFERLSKADDDDSRRMRWYVAAALGRTGSPDAVAPVARILAGDDADQCRRESAVALGRLPYDETSAEALAGALDDGNSRVRHAAVSSLLLHRDRARLPLLIDRLGVETNSLVRGRLYEAVSMLAPSGQALRVLAGSAWRADPADRLELVHTLARLDGDDQTRLLVQALSDPDRSVVAASLDALAGIGTPTALQHVLDAVRSPDWAAASTAVHSLVERREPRAVKPIVARLSEDELSGMVTDPLQRDRIYALLDALIALDGEEAEPLLRKTADAQTDAPLVQRLRSTAEQLSLRRTLGQDVDAWAARCDDADPDVRHLAYRQLRRIGTSAAGDALAARFGRVEPEEGVEIVRATSGIRCPAVSALLERLLLDGSFDRSDRAALRDMAAWSARRTGGPEMTALLRRSIERSHAANARVLLYLAQIDPAAAAADYERWRIERMRAVRWSRGSELRELDAMDRAIAHGESLERWDVPPERLDLR